MEAKVISAKELKKFIDNVIKSGIETYGVQYIESDKAYNKFHYAPLKSAKSLRLDYDVTVIPPKKFFTPVEETLFKFSKSPDVKTTPVFETNRKVLFGVHPYDMIAINQMDEVFKDKFEDAHYF